MVETIVLVVLVVNAGVMWWCSFKQDEHVQWMLNRLESEQNELIHRLDIVGQDKPDARVESMLADFNSNLNDVKRELEIARGRLLSLERNAPEKGPQSVRGVVAARRMVADLGGAKDIQ